MKNRFYVDESGINKYLRREHVILSYLIYE